MLDWRAKYLQAQRTDFYLPAVLLILTKNNTIMKLMKNLQWVLLYPFRDIIFMKKCQEYSELRRNAWINARDRYIRAAKECVATNSSEIDLCRRLGEIADSIYWEGDGI